MKVLLITALLTMNIGYATAAAGNLNIDPTSLKLKVYKLAVSTSPLCTDLVTVIDDTTPTEVDFLVAPSLGSGLLADGTYNCIVIEFSDNIKFTPNATSTAGNCVNGTEATLDVCSDGTSTMIDGTTTTCSVANEKVAMYLSTSSTSTGNADAFKVPTASTFGTVGFKLGAALVVSGTASAKFVVNGTDNICDTADGSCSGNVANSCEFAAPTFTFVQL